MASTSDLFLYNVADLKVKWCVLCDNFLLDQTGKYSLIGIFDGINGSKYPMIYPQFFVVALWEGIAKSVFEVSVAIKHDDQEIARIPPFKMQLSTRGWGLTVSRFAQMSFSQPGLYRVETFLEGRSEAASSNALELNNNVLMPSKTSMVVDDDKLKFN